MAYRAGASSRRAFPRVPTEIRVHITRPDHSPLELIPATLQDISQNGAMVITTKTIPLGEWIALRPDHRGPAFGEELTAIVDRVIPAEGNAVKLACRFPEPLDYAVLRNFM